MKAIFILLVMAVMSQGQYCTTSVINAKLYYRSNNLNEPCSLSFDVRVARDFGSNIGRFHARSAGAMVKSYILAVGDTFAWYAGRVDTFSFASPQGRLVIFPGYWSWMNSWVRDTVVNNKVCKITTPVWFTDDGITYYFDLYEDGNLYSKRRYGVSDLRKDSVVKPMPPVLMEPCTLRTSAVEAPKPISSPASKPIKVYDAMGRPVRGEIGRMPQGIYFVWDGRSVRKQLNIR